MPGSDSGDSGSGKDDAPVEPTEEEVRDYALFIGMDPDKEAHLMWIAREGVAAPVPPPWKACEEDDEVFYFNFETSESIWDHPCDAKYRELLAEHRKKGPPASSSSETKAEAADSGGSPVAEASDRSPTRRNNSFDSESSEDERNRSDKSKSFVSEAVASDSEGSDAGRGGSRPSSPTKGGQKAQDARDSDDSKSFVSDAAGSSSPSSPKEGKPSLAERRGMQLSGMTPTSTNRSDESPFSPAVDKPQDFPKDEITSPKARSDPKEDATPKLSLPMSPLSPTSPKPTSPEAAQLWKSMAGGDSDDSRSSRSSRSPSPRSSPRSEGSSPQADQARAREAPPSAGSSPRSEGSSPQKKPESIKSASSPRSNASSVDYDPPAQSPAAAPKAAGGPQSPSSAAVSPAAKATAGPQSPPSAASSPAGKAGAAESPQIPYDSAGSDVPGAEKAADISPKSGSSSNGSVPAKSQGEASPTAGVGLVPALHRAGPVLDHNQASHSARSSNLSEVSEDFRSDWGAASPAGSARSGTGGTPKEQHGNSLELSLTMSMSAKDMPAVSSSALKHCSKVSEDGESQASRESPVLGRDSGKGLVTRSWRELQSELKTLAEVLSGIKGVRSMQAEYLRRLKTGA